MEVIQGCLFYSFSCEERRVSMADIGKEGNVYMCCIWVLVPYL